MSYRALTFAAAFVLVWSCLGSTAQARTVEAPSQSSNWSGYVFQGGPFTDVAASFTVPDHASGTGDMAEWVGVDGYSNTNLIQAGVEVSGDGSGLSYAAWWEILPSAEVVIPWMNIEPGDTVNVGIRKTAADTWGITMSDGTQVFNQTFSYAGLATSAEWVVEAPNVDGLTSSLLPYGDVEFSNLALDGRAALMDQVWLVQGKTLLKGGELLSAPESWPSARALIANGFASDYVGS